MRSSKIFLCAALCLPVKLWAGQFPEYREARTAAFEELSALLPQAAEDAADQPVPGIAGPALVSGDQVRRDYQALLLRSPNLYDALTRPQLRTLYRDSYYNKVASFEKLPLYDPSEQLGFCFGRAIASHLLARKMGLKEAGTGKVFIVGELKSEGVTLWRFHVSAIVKGPGGAWYAIDSNLPGPVTLKEWIKETRAVWDEGTKARVYVTHAAAVFPDIRVFPAIAEEKGENLIELSFEPSGRDGFAPLDGGLGPLVYSVDENAAKRYFTGIDEDGAEDRFDFLGVTVAGERYDYRNYFADLVADIGGQPAGGQERVSASVAGSLPLTAAPKLAVPGMTGSTGKRLFSPRWGTR